MDSFIIIFLILFPLLLIKFQNQLIIKNLGPVIICYAFGIFLGNVLEIDQNTIKFASEVSVPLAIPLLLISCDFMSWIKNSNKTIISFSFVLLSVLVMSTVTSYAFADSLPEFKKLAAMMVGVYTGGTPNLSAIGLALNISSETFVLLNTADVILGGIYLLFIFTVGKRVYSLILPSSVGIVDCDLSAGGNFFELCGRDKVKHSVFFIIISGIAVGVSSLISNLIFQKDNIAFIILFISSVGILLSSNKKIKKIAGSYEVGEYLLLIFCISIGMMVNISDIQNASFTIMIYAGLVMFGSIILHTLLCFFFKIDRNTAIITSVAGIFGPPFVAPVAQSLGNRSLIIAGVTSGLIGYGVGNFLGLGLYYFLNL